MAWEIRISPLVKCLMFNIQCALNIGKHVNVNSLQVHGMMPISLSRLTFVCHCNGCLAPTVTKFGLCGAWHLVIECKLEFCPGSLI